MNNERFKRRIKRFTIIGVIILVCCVAAALILQPYMLKNKYRSFSALNGGHPYADITINGKEYLHEYSHKYHRLESVPEGFNEISREDNEIVSEDFAGNDVVFVSEEHPEVVFVRSRRFNGPGYTFKGGYYYCLVNSDVRFAHLVYKNHDWCYNYLTCMQGAEDIPDDLKELPADKFTIDNDFLGNCPTFTSRTTGMVYFEVMEDILYIPYERIEAMPGGAWYLYKDIGETETEDALSLK